MALAFGPIGQAMAQVADAPRAVAMTALQRLPEDEALALAFRAAFPEGARVEKKRDDQPSMSWIYTYKPRRLLWRETDAVLISDATVVDDCHACGGRIGFHYLEPGANGFTVRGAWQEFNDWGSWGKPASWRLRTDVTALPVVEIKISYGAQGVVQTSLIFVELGADQPLELVDPIRLAYDATGHGGRLILNDEDEVIGQEEPHVVIGKVETEPSRASFTVRYSGSRNFDVVYTRVGNRFVAPPDSPSPSPYD
jgi:hypothetical protein